MVRQLDQELNSETPTADGTATSIRMAMDDIDKAAPNVSAGIWVWAVTGVAKEKEDPTIDATTIDRGARSRLTRFLKRLLA
jgi:hypothetical protein